jgi:hypothetical protein
MSTQQTAALEKVEQTGGLPAALEQLGNTAVALHPTAHLDRENLKFFASMIRRAGLVPTEQGVSPDMSEARVMAKIVGGVAYNFDPIGSQENLHVIQGRLTLSARGYEILLKRGGRFDTRIEYLNDDGCKLAVLEKNNEGKWILKGYVEFTREMANKAQLLSKDMYKKYGPDMFYARCISRVVKRLAPEVMDGRHIVTYDLAKQQASDPPTPTPGNGGEGGGQLPSATSTETAPPAVGDEYIDREYAEASAIADNSIDAEFVETKGEVEYTGPQTDSLFSEEESKNADLITAISDYFKEKLGGDDDEIRKFLKGRDLSQMTTAALTKLHGELEAL